METAVTVAPLVLSVSRIIYKIVHAAELAAQNKVECNDLAGRLSVIYRLLPRLQLQGPEAAEALVRLGYTLNDAHKLVVACHKSGTPRKFTLAAAHAERFAKLNRRIDSHINLIQLCCHIDITRRLDDHTSLRHPLPTTMVADDYKVPWLGNYPRSQQLVLWWAFLLSLMLMIDHDGRRWP